MRNVPRGPQYLNIWSPVGSAVQGGGRALVGEVLDSGVDFESS